MKNKIIITLLLSVLHAIIYAQGGSTYSITNLTQKHKYSVYAMTKQNGKWYVTTSVSAQKGKTYTDIYLTDSLLKNIAPFAKEIMTGLDDGTPVFDGNTMYYTSVYADFKDEGNSMSKRLKIESAVRKGGVWKKTNDFPFNSPEYRTAHPAITRDGTMMVFASDMQGGKGGMDLYYSMKRGNTWQKPQNISNLNSSGNEVFPVFDDEGNLTYSSDSLGGLGGLDLFSSKCSGGNFYNPVHLPDPLNSEYDDFYLYSENGLKSGYLSSNRVGKHTKDDILYFTAPNKQPNIFSVSVLDKYTRTPLPYAMVTIKDASGQVFHRGMTGPDGVFTFDDLPNGIYSIQGVLNDISTNQVQITEEDFSSGKAGCELYHNDPRFTLAGMAINSRDNTPLNGVEIICLNTTTDKTKSVVTQEDGAFFFQLEQNSNFVVQGSKEGWFSSEMVEKTTKGLDRSTQLYVNIKLQIEKPVNNGTIALRQIRYDYNQTAIRQDAIPDLNRIIKLLKDYPDMTIELSSHTDSRGSEDYNLQLSQARAIAAVNYLVKQGISKKRLIPKGYGESKLLNRCKNHIECTEQEHEENRRTEFTVLSCLSCK